MTSFTDGSVRAHASMNSALPSVEPSLTKSNSQVAGRFANFSNRSRNKGKTRFSFRKGTTTLSSGWVIRGSLLSQTVTGAGNQVYSVKLLIVCPQVRASHPKKLAIANGILYPKQPDQYIMWFSGFCTPINLCAQLI